MSIKDANNVFSLKKLHAYYDKFDECFIDLKDNTIWFYHYDGAEFDHGFGIGLTPKKIEKIRLKYQDVAFFDPNDSNVLWLKKYVKPAIEPPKNSI